MPTPPDLDLFVGTRWDESGCEADMLESAEGGRTSPSRPQQEPINLKNEVHLTQYSTLSTYTFVSPPL
ncbi:unnamed protein product [Pieris brassicae]|nr:unnamed protein product [Pieris brassicae]